jgi:hypothetical protein
MDNKEDCQAISVTSQHIWRKETFVTVMETPQQVEFIAAVLFTMKPDYFIQY